MPKFKHVEININKDLEKLRLTSVELGLKQLLQVVMFAYNCKLFVKRISLTFSCQGQHMILTTLPFAPN